MSSDAGVVSPIGSKWEDKFGGEVWFKDILTPCSYKNPTAEVRIKSPFGDSEYVYVTKEEVTFEYLSSTKMYTITLHMFCGIETTSIFAETNYSDRVFKGFIYCQAYDSISNEELNTTIQIDGVTIVPMTPHTTIGLSTGSHTITFILDGYATTSTPVNVVVGKTVNAYGSMVKSTGTISCTSDPTDAMILIGEVKPGVTTIHTNTLKSTSSNGPVLLADINPGTWSIRYEKDKYTGCNDVVTVSAGHTINAHCSLILIETTGSLECITVPTNADVYLDGSSISSGKTPLVLDSLGPGIHTVIFKIPNYEDCTVQQNVEVGIINPITCYMVELPPPVGYLHCNAFDSITNKELNANVFLDPPGASLATLTPLTTNGLIPSLYDLTFTLENYFSKTISINVESNKTIDAHVNLIKIVQTAPGFDINVNVPGLLPGLSLILMHVVKVPLTNTWIPDPLSIPADTIRWDNISNKHFKARQEQINCDPAPTIFQGSPVKVGDHYVIEVTSPLDIIYYYVEQDIIQVTDTTTDITIIKQTIPPEWMLKLCGWFDVAEGDCIESFYNVIPDILFSAEDLSIIMEGKSIYPPYEEKEPTPWNYAFVGLTFIPGSGAIKGAGKAGTKIVKSSKLYPDTVLNLIHNGRWQSAWYPEKQLTFLESMWDLTGAHLDEVVAKLEIDDVDGASALITKYLTEKPTADQCVKNLGTFTKELFDKLPNEMPKTLIREAELESSFVTNAGKVIYAKSPPTSAALNTLDELYSTFPRAKELFVTDAGNILKQGDASDEMIHRVINASVNYPTIIEDLGTKTPLDTVDDLIINAVNKVGYEHTPTLTKTLFKNSLIKTLESPIPIKLTGPQTTSIKNIIKNDPTGFTNAMSEFDIPFRLKFIKSMELSGADGLDALSKAEGAASIARHEDIYNTFGIHIHDVIDAYTDSYSTMPEFWSKLGIDSINFAADGKIIENTPPYLTRYLAELAESKLSREVAEELVHRSLMKDSISQIISKDLISNDEILSLHNLYVKYPIAADRALKEIEPTELARFINILERTDEGKFVSEIFRVREELIEKLGVDAADEMLEFWMVQLRTVVDDATRRSLLNRLSTEIITYPSKHPAKFIVMLISAIAGPIGLAEFILWRMKETLWDPPSFNLFKAVQEDDKTSAKEMLITFKYLIEKYEPTFKLISYATPFSITMVPDYILNTKLTHDLYAEILGVPDQKFFKNEYVIPESIEGTVSQILDGDTVKVDFKFMGVPEKEAQSAEDSTIYKNNTLILTTGGDFEKGTLELSVRLLGINTPEDNNYKYTCTELKEPFLVRRLLTPGKECIEEETWNVDEPFYNSTKEWIGINLPVHQIAKFYSDTERQFDKYGRLLASPFYNSKYVCNESLRAGQSVVFFYDDNNQVDKTNFLESEKVAKDANIGVWHFTQEPDKTGWIKFISEPTATEVLLDDVNVGKTVSNTLLVETTLGTHTYEFKKIGYLGCKGTISEINNTHTENDPLEKECYLELEDPTCSSPNASFVISPTTPIVNEHATFNASASTAGSNTSIKSYTWNFGDGSTGTGEVLTHLYDHPGSYVAELIVKNNCGKTDVATKSLTIKEVVDTGNITIKAYSSPGVPLSSVTVYVDNIDKGNAPITVKDLITGSHSIRLEKSGYLGCTHCEGVACTHSTEISPCDFGISVEKDITKVVEVTMLEMFEFEIDSIPAGATVTIDGTTLARVKHMNLIEQIMTEQKW